MFMFRTVATIARGTRRTVSWKRIVARAFVACAFGGIAIGIAWATPGVGISTTIVSGPVELDKTHLVTESPDHGVIFMTKGQSDVYVVSNTIVPGGNTGWSEFVWGRPSLSTIVESTVPANPFEANGLLALRSMVRMP